MTAADLLEQLRAWRARGLLRALDLAFVQFLLRQDPSAPPSLLLAAALLAQLEGRGHSCLPLQALLRDPATVLAWPVAEPGADPAADLAADLALLRTLLPADAAAARAAWAGSALLQVEPADDRGSTPLVLQHDRLALRRYWRHERQVAAQVRARTQPGSTAPPDPAAVRVWMDLLFAPLPAAPDDAAVDWQRVACAVALRAPLGIVTGGPGTGKTYTAARLLVLLQALHAGPQPLRVALAAPTGKAAARLRQSIGSALQDLQAQHGDRLGLAGWALQLGPARTLHALLGTRPGTRRFVHDAAEPLEVDVLFVDEASMVHLEMMDSLLDALPAGARLVLLGDRDQLASVEAGAVLGDLCQPVPGTTGHGAYDAQAVRWIEAATGQRMPAVAPAATTALAQQTVVLRRSRRFAGPIGQLAQALNAGDGAAALALLQQGAGPELALVQTVDAGRVAALAVDGRAGATGGYRAYLQRLAQRPDDPGAFDAWVAQVLRDFDGCRVLCALRDGPWGVSGLNAAIERSLVAHGLLPQRREAWYAGRPVMVTRNDAALGVFNGDIGIVLAPPGGGSLRAYFLDGSVLRSVSVARLADVETAFAMTVHKSQGSEFGHVLLALPDIDTAVLTRELVYTGITRARTACTLVAAQPALLARAAGRRTQRLSGLQALLGAGA
jgi:exodeoxyribonuclease V alpha subunit